MTAGQVIIRSGTADSAGTHTGLLTLRPAHIDSRIRIDHTGINHRLADDEQVRVHLTASNKPGRYLPQVEIPLRREGLVGLRFWGSASAEYFVHFLGEGSALATRRVDSGGLRWYEPPQGTKGLAFSMMVSGTGQTFLDAVDVILPPLRAGLPIGPHLTDALTATRFPSGRTAWPAHFTVDSITPTQVSINGRELSLVEPDWHSVEDANRTWQLFVHGFCFAHSMLDSLPHGTYLLADLILDWVEAHPIRPHSTTVMSWNDMAVSKRTMALLAVLDRMRFDSSPSVLTLAEQLAEHARWLAHPRNYLAGHDHGLYSDTALEFAARALEMHPLSDRWRTRAQTRFRTTAGAVIDAEEGTVKEHSPAYVEAVAELLEERRRNGLSDDLGDQLGERFSDTLAILTTPDGHLFPWGDTDVAHPSPAARTLGVKGYPDTGWAVGHHPDSAVALTSSFHSHNHKHCDELSFLYYDRSGPIIMEAGLPGYDYGSDDREFAESASGHSRVLISGDIAQGKCPTPFGGAVAYPAAAGDWQALLGWNPLLEESLHHRILFHHPEILIVVDLVTGQSVREVTRLFHIAPRLSVELQTDSARLGDRLLSLDWPRLAEIRLAPPHESRHFESGDSVVHDTVAVTSHGPGLHSAIISPASSPCRLSAVDVVGTRRNIEISVSLDTGVQLALAAVPGDTPRELKLSAS